MNKIPNRAAICQVLMEEAKKDKDLKKKRDLMIKKAMEKEKNSRISKKI